MDNIKDPLGILSKEETQKNNDPLGILNDTNVKKKDEPEVSVSESPIPGGDLESIETEVALPDPSNLESITGSLMSQDEDEVVQSLQGLFPAESGFEFSPTGFGFDRLKVKYGDKEKNFKIDAFTKAGDEEAAESLKSWMGALLNPVDEDKSLTARLYEENQKALSDLDARISQIEAPSQGGRASYATGGLVEQRNKRLASLKAERAALSKKSDQLVEDTTPDIKEIVNKNVGDNYNDFLNESGEVDVEKIGDLARREAMRYGLPEDGYFFQRIKDAVQSKVTGDKLNSVAQRIFEGGMYEPTTERAKERAIEKYGSVKPRYEKGVYEEMFGVKPSEAADQLLSKDEVKKQLGLKQLETDFSIQMNQLRDNIESSSSRRLEELAKEKYGMPIDEYASRISQGYQSSVNAIESKYSSLMDANGNWIGTQEQADAFNAEMKSAYDSYKTNFDAFVADNTRDVASINNKANKRFERQRDEALKQFQAEYLEKAKAINPMLEDRFREAYAKSLDKAMDIENVSKEARAFMRSPLTGGALGISGLISGASGQMKNIMRSLGMNDAGEFFEQVSLNYDIGDTEIKEWGDLLDPKKAIKSTSYTLGGMAPMLAASFGVGALTGGTGAPATLTTLAAGTAGWGVETMSITQDTYDRMFKETGSVQKAEEAASKALNGQVMLMPMYALEMLPFFGDIGVKLSKVGINNILTRGAVGGVIETAAEMGQEFPQGLFEKAIFDDKQLSDAFDYASVEGFENTLMNVAPTTMLMGGGGAAMDTNTQTKEERIASLAETLAMKVNMGELSEAAMEQAILKMTVNHGQDFARAFVNIQLREGRITEEQATKAASAIDISLSTIETAKENNLSDKNSYLLATMNLKLNAAKASAESQSDPGLKKAAEEKVKGLEKQVSQLVKTGDVDVFMVKYPDGQFDILTHDEARLSMSNDEFMRNLASGKVKVEAMGIGQEKLMSELADKIKPFLPQDTKAEDVIEEEVSVSDQEVLDELAKERGEGTPYTQDEFDSTKEKLLKQKQDDQKAAEQERLDTEEQGRQEDTGEVQESEVSQEEGTGDSVLQEQEEVEQAPSTQESLNDLLDNKINSKRIPFSDKTKQKRVVRAAKLALKSLAKNFPNVKMVVHENEESYVSQQNQRKSNQGGQFNFDTNTIHINLDKATVRTVAHEVFHAVLLNKLGLNEIQSITDEMLKSVENSARISKKLKSRLEQHKAKYPDGLQSEEALAELTGILASEYKTLSLTAKRFVQKWANKLSNLLGRGNIFEQAAKDQEVIDFLNVLSRKVSKGEVIESQDVQDISERRVPIDQEVEEQVEEEVEEEPSGKYDYTLITPQEKEIISKAAEKAKMAIDDFVLAVASGTYDASVKIVEIAKKLVAVSKQAVSAIGRIVNEQAGKAGFVKDLIAKSISKKERSDIAKEEGIQESEVNDAVENEVKNQINDKKVTEPKTLLQKAASKIKKALIGLLIVSNAVMTTSVDTKKTMAYDNIKVESIEIFDEIPLDQEAIDKKNNIETITESQKNNKKPYIIVDKSTGSAHLFLGDSLITTFEVAVGEVVGDRETKIKSIYINSKTGKESSLSEATELKNGVRYLKEGYESRTNWNDGTKTTGAGIFKVKQKGDVLGSMGFLLETEQGLVTEMALHVANAVRSKLLSDGNPDNNRVTNGCINFLYESLMEANNKGFDTGSMVFVLPDNQNNQYTFSEGTLRFESSDLNVNRSTSKTKPYVYQPVTFHAGADINSQSKEFLVNISLYKAEIMEMYPGLSNNEYNNLAKIAYGIFGQETSFGTYGKVIGRGKYGYIRDLAQIQLNKLGIDEVNVFGYKLRTGSVSAGLTQTRLSSIPKEARKKLGINSPADLLNNQKSAAATMAALAHMYVNEIAPTGLASEMESIVPLAWSNSRKESSPFKKALKGDKSQYNNQYVKNVKKNSSEVQSYIGETPINQSKKPVIREQIISDEEYYNQSQETPQDRKKDPVERNKLMRAFDKTVNQIRKRFFDFQGRVKSILNNAEIQRISDRLATTKGSPGRAKMIFDEFYQKIYDGLLMSEKKVLDEIIKFRRIISANTARIKRNAEAQKEYDALTPQVNKLENEIESLEQKDTLTDNETEKLKNNKEKLKALNEKQAELDAIRNRPEIMTGKTGLEGAKASLRHLRQKLGDEKFDKIDDRATEYFAAFDKMLDDDLKNGLITQEQYDYLKGIEFSPREFMSYVYDVDGELIRDKDAFNNVRKNFSLSKDNFDTLKDGILTEDLNYSRPLKKLRGATNDSYATIDRNDGKGEVEISRKEYNEEMFKFDRQDRLFELMIDSEVLLGNYLLTREKKRAYNDLNREMAKELPALLDEFEELSRKKDLTKAEKKRLRQLKMIDMSFSLTQKPNFSTLFYYNNGVREKIFVRKDIYDEWYDNKLQWVDKKTEQAISKWTGSRLLKAMATGANPLFALTNAPRDFFQVLAFSSAYSSFIPMSMFQLGYDFAKAVAQMRKMSPEFVEFMKYGGMMDFLAMEGRGTTAGGNFVKNFFKKQGAKTWLTDLALTSGSKLGSKIVDKMTGLNQYSEIGFRLAVFNKVLEGEMKKIDKRRNEMTKEEIEMAIEDAKYRAAAASRELIDFSIGGDITKAIDPYLPYLNAATQGSYVAVKALVDNPIDTTVRFTQLAGIYVGLFTAASREIINAFKDDDDENSVDEIYRLTKQRVSPHTKKMYFVIPTGRRDEQGNYEYLKIAKNHSLIPFFMMTEMMIDDYFFDIKESDKSKFFRLQDAAGTAFLPLDINPVTIEGDVSLGKGIKEFGRNPLLGGLVESYTGYNFYRDEPLSREIYKDNIPEFIKDRKDPRIEEFYKDFAKFTKDNTGLSIAPVRFKNMLERFITSPYTNPGTNMLYAGLDRAAKSGDEVFESKEIGEELFDLAKQTAGSKRLFGYATYTPKESVLTFKQEKEIDAEIDKIALKAADISRFTKSAAKRLGNNDTFLSTNSQALKVEMVRDEFSKIQSYIEKNTGEPLSKRDQDRMIKIFETQVNTPKNSDNFKYFNVMYERDPDLQALLWIQQFGYLEPGSDELRDRVVEYNAAYSSVFGRKPSKNFKAAINKYYRKAGIIQ